MNINSDYLLDNIFRLKLKSFDFCVTERFVPMFESGEYEKFSADLVDYLLEESHTFLDIGSHYGYYSMIAAKKLRNGNVIAIEPSEANHIILGKNISCNKLTNVVTHNIAISDKSGTSEFLIANASDSSGLTKHPNTKTLDVKEVQTLTVDDLLGGKKVDFIKIDTEGHELNVLEGMTNTLNANENLKLLVEFNPKVLLANNQQPKALLDKLSQLGFDRYLIDDKGRKMYKLDDNNNYVDLVDLRGYANILCVKKSNYIAFFSHSHSLKGGAEKSLMGIIKVMLKNKYLCHITLPSEGQFYDELQVLPISTSMEGLDWWCGADKVDTKALWYNAIHNIDSLVDQTARINPDLIYSNTSVIIQGALIARLLKKKHIHHIREFGELDHKLKYKFGITERAFIISELSDKVIFISNALAEYYGINSEKAAVLYNFVDDLKPNTKIKEPHNVLSFGVLGNIQPSKGQLLAIKALHTLIHEHKLPCVELLIGGEGEHNYVEQLKREVIKLKLQDKVRFCGYVKTEEFIPLLDILTVPSSSEAFGRVTIEAMALKVPVIASDSGGTPEIITDSYNGRLFKNEDASDFALKIAELHKDISVRNELVAAGRKTYEEKYSAKVFEAKFIEILNDVINNEPYDSAATGLSGMFIDIYEDVKKALDLKEQELAECSMQNKLLQAEIQSRNQQLKSIRFLGGSLMKEISRRMKTWKD